ncbi:hypothetical protein MXL46_00010 [Heyndrickxia sporothermodurans]|uniref:hypothetical protein n=1 Tax=Heyndrickxia sporothermodurans TaxID=46224 RepID=UPI002DBA3307|nr:hypothetical protein [Heyndrickxia sporothermodurans]MEB6547489.1 hypothetical protein [Heyndrickxia sporothermodurans]MED1712045.1 hypothetical protein [Bacillus thuringiensis]
MKAKVNLQRISYEKDTKNKDKIVHYVAFYNNSEYFKNINLKSGQFLDRNSDPNDFLSTIKTSNKHQLGQIEIFHNFDPIEIRPIIAAGKTKDIKGTYTLIGTKNAENFKRIALDFGFTVNISKEQSDILLTPYPYQDMIYKASFILWLFDRASIIIRCY